MTLRGKYFVARVDKETLPGRRHAHCSFLVLDLNCDPWARAAVEAILKCELPHELEVSLRAWLRTGEPPVAIEHASLAQAGLAEKKEAPKPPQPHAKGFGKKRKPRKSMLDIWRESPPDDDDATES